MALDEAAPALTVKARLVTPDARAALDGLQAGEPIVITWSGHDRYANGIRALTRGDGSGLWGGDRFLLPATFVAATPDQGYLTFRVTPPAESVATMRTLRRGAWATFTSPHQPAARVNPVATVAAYAPPPSRRPAPTYRWVGEFVDFEVAETVISLSAPVEEHVLRYVRRFSPGDAVMLIWAPSDDDTVHTAIRSVQHRDQLSIRRGYILPVEFVDADWIQQRITFKTKVLPDSIIAPASLHPGHRIEVTSPLEQAGETAAILSVEGATGAP